MPKGEGKDTFGTESLLNIMQTKLTCPENRQAKKFPHCSHDFSQWNFRTHQKKPIALSLHVCVHRILDCEYIYMWGFFVLFFFKSVEPLLDDEEK